MNNIGAWYQFNYDSNFGSFPDPVGNYPKPDANFYGIPNGTPITALASGTVTSVRRQPWGPLAYSVTVKFDNAWNSVAQYYAVNYVSRPNVHVGQHVQAGQTLAYSGNPYNIGTAFALSDSPVYGTSTANEPFSGTYVNPALNPVPFLQAAIGSGGLGGQLTDIMNSGLQGLQNETVIATPNNTNSNSNSFLGFDFSRFIDAGLLFLIGLVLVIVGALLLVGHFGGDFLNSNTGQQVKTAAEVAAA